MSLGRPRLLLLAGLAALLVLGAAALVVWRSAGSASVASEDAALAALRLRGGASEQAHPGVPRAGVYTYAQRGREGASGGFADVSRDLPATALYIVSPTPEGYHEDLRFNEEHVEEVRFAASGGETRALWRRTKVTFVGIGEDTQADQVPPPLDHPHRLRVGMTWGADYASGDVPVSSRSRVAAARAVRLDGRSVPAMVIRTDSRTGGNQPGVRRDEVWWAPSLSLPVRWRIEQDYEGSAPFTMRADLELTSATPRVS